METIYINKILLDFRIPFAENNIDEHFSLSWMKKDKFYKINTR